MNSWEGIVSLFIACIELVLIINILIFAEKTQAVKTGILLIIVLFIYQFMEFLICGMEFKTSLAGYIAFADITLLPPLSLLFISSVTGRGKILGRAAFIPALFFIIYYGFVIDEFVIVSCTVFYAAYNYPWGTYYGAFYYTPVLISIIILYLNLQKEISRKERVLTVVLLTGFILTSIPVMTAFFLSASGDRRLLDIIESIMCKFAIFIAIASAIYSLSYLKKKNE